MNRLTYKVNDHYYFDNVDDLIDVSNKLGQLEDLMNKYNIDNVSDLAIEIRANRDKVYKYENIEKELGIDLIILFKALENGFYYIINDEIKFCRWCVRVGNYLVETKPCYAVKETTIQSCYYGDVSELKQTKDAHYWDWDTSLHVELKDYGKTWALTRDELL